MKLETATKFCISTWLSHLTTLYIIIIFFDRAIDDLNYFVQPCFEITSLRQTGQEQLFWKTNTQNELENWSDQITKIQHARTQHTRSQHARSRHTRPQYTRWPIIMCVSISRVSKLCSFDPSKFWFRKKGVLGFSIFYLVLERYRFWNVVSVWQLGSFK